MLEKIKTVAKYIVLPLTLLFGLIFYLFQQISSLKSEVKRKEAEKALGDALGKLEDGKKNADLKETEFDNDYSDYKRARDDSES
jgi:hypothetical protein